MLMSYSVVLCQIFRSQFLGVASDFTDEYNAFSLWVLQEHFKAINEIGSVEGVTADTDTKRLT